MKHLSHYHFRLNIIKNLIKDYYKEKNKMDELFYFDDERDDFVSSKKKT